MEVQNLLNLEELHIHRTNIVIIDLLCLFQLKKVWHDASQNVIINEGVEKYVNIKNCEPKIADDLSI